MKFVFISFLITGTIAITACNNNNHSTEDKSNSSIQDSAGKNADRSLKEQTSTKANVNPKIATAFKEIVDQYLQIKNALAEDKASEAASSAKSLTEALARIDASAFTPEQKKLFKDNADDLKENAEHIGKNAGKIAHQREHFAMLSEDVYDLVKGFGSTQPLYLHHCPMAQDNKGANWLSETKENHNNPYFGKKMPECGSVVEEIKK